MRVPSHPLGPAHAAHPARARDAKLRASRDTLEDGIDVLNGLSEIEFEKEEGEDGEDILQGMVKDVRSMLKDAEKASGEKEKETKSAGAKKEKQTSGSGR